MATGEDTRRLSIRELSPPIGEKALLVVVHLPSKLWQKDEDQIFSSAEITKIIDTAETKVGHDRTLVVGDFNMSPFEKGLVAAGGFHAVMDRRIAERGQRIVQGKRYQFFYNPMWGHLGDTGSGPAGTYFYENSSYVNYFWLNRFARKTV